MIRRLTHALAAMFVFAAASLVWAQPAQAAPAGLCSIDDWRNPANFVDCARRARDAVGNQAGCVSAPTPGSPTSGIAGWFTSRPDSSLRDGVSGQYSRYGVGGYGLDTYDIGCLGNLKHPDLVAWNTIASAEFSSAASIMGAANALRDLAYDPGSMWGWADGFLNTATTAVFEHVFTPLGALTLAVIGLLLIWQARQGQMSQTMRITAWALFIMVAVTGVARWPVAAAHGADTVASTGLRVMHSVLGPAPQDIPADKCVLGGDSCTDHRTAAVRASDVATEAVLYRTWLRAVLGSADTDTAKKYGPALYDATTMSWGEAVRAEQGPQLRQQLIDQKAQTWNTIAEQIRAEDPLAYEHLQGIHGSDRAGAGAVALLSAAAFAAFDVVASAVILFGFLIFRVAIVLLPLLGTVGVALPAAGGVRRLFHMTAAAAMNIVVFGAAAGLYLTAVDLVFGSALPGVGQLFAVALCGTALFLLLHPGSKFVHIATGRSRPEDGLFTKLIKQATSHDAGSGDPDDDPPATAGHRERPETAAPRPRHTGSTRPSAAPPAQPAPDPSLAGPRPEVAAQRRAAVAVGEPAAAAVAVRTRPEVRS